ncbi:MAG TPA: DUF2730 family protein [Nitratidesulfovibrio sp.]|nr:DUF2730 family protein [Nitratidesulfovibrio sp.]
MAVLEQVREWTDALNAGLAVVQVLMIAALAGMRKFFTTPAQVEAKIAVASKAQSEVAECQRKDIETLGERVGKVETAMKNLPTAQDIQSLLLAVEGVRGATRELSLRIDGLADEQAARLDGMRDVLGALQGQVSMLYNHHLKEK